MHLDIFNVDNNYDGKISVQSVRGDFAVMSLITFLQAFTQSSSPRTHE